MKAQESLQAAVRVGALDPIRVAAVGAALGRWGPTIAASYAAAALRYPTRAAVVDHRGTVRFGQLELRSSLLASGLLAVGLKPGQRLGLFCGNHRHFVEANLAAAKAGLHVVYLNTGFAAPQLGEVLEREQVDGVVCDADLLPVLDQIAFNGPVIVADGRSAGRRSVRQVRRLGARRPAVLRPRVSSPVLLTSGTTGLPKGAQRSLGVAELARSGPSAVGGAAGMIRRLRYQTSDVFAIPSPLFHAWGLSQLVLAASLGAPVVLDRRFTPEAVVRSVVANDATVLCVVPIMLQRMLATPDLDLSPLRRLRIVASSGSALSPSVAEAWMDAAGDTLFNLYGSTEVGQATIATPQDLRQAPGTVGRVVPGIEVAILDDDGAELPTGSVGRIFVKGGGQFSGYTGGGSKEMVAGQMSSGDVGYFDDDDRLFVTGRADDMIVSGGENVFPREIEDTLLALDEVTDVAVIGVDDEDFGQRLAAYIVVTPGAKLTAKSVRAAVANRLARYKVPRDVSFLDELPRNKSGKVQRSELPAN